MLISTMFFDGSAVFAIARLATIFGVGFLASILVILAFVPQNQFALNWQLLRSASIYSVSSKMIVVVAVTAFPFLMIVMGVHDPVTLVVALAALLAIVIGLMMTLSIWIWKWDSLTAFMFVLCLIGCWAMVAWGVQKLSVFVA